MPEELIWDQTLVPDVHARLLSVPLEKRVRPVIVDRNGLPYRKDTWSDRFRAQTKIELQQPANHADGKTTERYIRETSAGANNVLRLRAERS